MFDRKDVSRAGWKLITPERSVVWGSAISVGSHEGMLNGEASAPFVKLGRFLEKYPFL